MPVGFASQDLWLRHLCLVTDPQPLLTSQGFVVGLGDRHFGNILLDVKTCEVVHIDLGVSFEQGRLLPIPELVPFRLTRGLPVIVCNDAKQM